MSRPTVHEVIERYDQAVEEFRRQDPRRAHDYWVSKVLTDHALLARLDLTEQTVLNVGCSFPLDELAFAHAVRAWIAVDLSGKSLALAREAVRHDLAPALADRLQFLQADARTLPFDNQRFDVAVSFSTIDHLPDARDRQRIVSEMARVVRAGGWVIVTVPNRLDRQYYRWSQRAQRRGEAFFAYEHCFTPGELRRLLTRAGLRVETFASTAVSAYTWPRGVTGRLLRWLIQPFGTRMGYLAQKP